MAIIVRIKAGFVSGTITDNPLLIGATTMNSAALANIPEVTSPDICALVLDADGSAAAPEIVYITAHTAAATSATIVRAREGTTAVEHPQTTDWAHCPTIEDFFPDNTTAGHLLTCTDANDGIPTWVAPADKVYRIPHGWAIAGEIKVASGDTDFINGIYLNNVTGQTMQITGYAGVINSGTSVTLDVEDDGSGITGFTGLSITTTPATATPTAQTIASGSLVAIVVSSVVGTPKNLSFTIFVDLTQ